MSSKGFWFSVVIIFLTVFCSDAFAAAPSNNDFADANSIEGIAGTQLGINIEATKELGEPYHAGQKGGASVWWKWIAPVSGSVAFDTNGSTFSTLLAIYTSADPDDPNALDEPFTSGNLMELASNDDGSIPPQGNVIINITIGTTYYIAVDGYGMETGDIVLNWDLTSNDDFALALAMPSDISGSLNGTNVDATKEGGEPDHAGNSGGASVWWQWVAPISGTVTIDTFGSDFDTLLGLYQGTSVDSLTLVASNDNDLNAADGTSLIQTDIIGGQTYYVVVDGFDGVMGSIVLNWSIVFNDNFADAILLTGISGAVIADDGMNNYSASKEPGEPDHAGGMGSSSVWWKWTSPSYGKLKINPTAITFDVLVGVYTGATVDSLVSIGDNNPATGDGTGIISIDVEPGTTYHIAFDGRGTDAGDIIFDWWFGFNDDFADAYTITGEAGTVGGTNKSATKETGEDNHTGAVGGSSIWWKWQSPVDDSVTLDTFGSEIDTVLAVYTGSSVDALMLIAGNDDVGASKQSQLRFDAFAGTTYYIVVDGYYGPAEQGYVNLSWVASFNDDFVDALEILEDQGTAETRSIGATKENGEPDHAGNAGGSSLWWHWTPTEDGFITVDTHGSDYDTLLAIYDGIALDGLTEVDSNDLDPDYDDGTSIIVAPVEAGKTYYIAVDAKDGLAGNLVLKWQFVFNDDFENAFVIEGNTGNTIGLNAAATEQIADGETPHAGVDPVSTLWWVWTATVRGTITFDTYGSGVDTVIAAYTGDELGQLTEVASNDDVIDPNGPGTPEAMISFDTTIGTTYYIVVDEKPTGSGQVVLNWNISVNDDFDQAYTLNGNKGQVPATNIGATEQSADGEPAHNGNGPATSVWWKWTAPRVSGMTFSVDGINADIAIYTGETLDALTEVAAGAGTVTFETTDDTLYYIAIDGDQGDFTLIWQMDYNDDFEDASEIVMEEITGTEEENNEVATKETGETTPGSRSLWWKWTAPSIGEMIIDTSGSNFDTILSVYTGDSVDNLVPVDDVSPEMDLAQFSTIGGITYYIAVTGQTGEFGDVKLAWEFIMPGVDNISEVNDGYTLIDSVLYASSSGINNEWAETIDGFQINGGDVHRPVILLWLSPASGDATFKIKADRFIARMGIFNVYTQTGPYVEDKTVDIADLVTDNLRGSSVGGGVRTLNFDVVGSNWYIIVIGGTSKYESGDIEIDLELVVNDGLSRAFDLRDGDKEYTVFSGEGDNLGGYTEGFSFNGIYYHGDLSEWLATSEPNEPNHVDSADTSLWWKWSTLEDTTIKFTTDTPGNDCSTLMAIYTKIDPNDPNVPEFDDLRLVDANDGGFGFPPRAEIIFDAYAGLEYFIAVDGCDAPEGLGKVELAWGLDFNDDLADAYDIFGAPMLLNTATGFNSYATREDDEVSSGRTIWWAWTSDVDGIAVFNTLGSNFVTRMYAYYVHNEDLIGPLAFLDITGMELDYQTNETGQTQIVFDVEMGTTYYIVVDGGFNFDTFEIETGDVFLNWYTITNDDFTDAEFLFGPAGMRSGFNNFTSLQALEPDHAGIDGNHSVWYSWTPMGSGQVQFDTFGSDFDTLLAVYKGNSVRELTEVASNDDDPDLINAPQSKLTFYAYEDVTYYIAVAGKHDGEAYGSGMVQLNHSLEEYNILALKKNGQGYVIIDGEPTGLPKSDVYPDGSLVTIEAAAELNWVFTGWTYTIGNDPNILVDPNLVHVVMLYEDAEFTANFDYLVNMKDFAEMASVWDVNGLAFVNVPDELAWWKLDDPNASGSPLDRIALDSTGNGFSGELVADPDLAWQPGYIDGAVDFTGEPNYIQTPSVVNPAETDVDGFSVFAWVKGGGPDQTIISQGNGSFVIEAGRRWLYQSHLDGFGITTGVKPAGGSKLESGFILNDDQWHHVGLVYDGTIRVLYGDGEVVAYDRVALGGSLEQADGYMFIGGDKTLALSRMWDGSIDDVRIYGQALTPDEVAGVYAGVSGPESPGTACVQRQDADLNDDCLVNMDDLLLFVAEWLQLR